MMAKCYSFLPTGEIRQKDGKILLNPKPFGRNETKEGREARTKRQRKKVTTHRELPRKVTDTAFLREVVTRLRGYLELA